MISPLSASNHNKPVAIIDSHLHLFDLAQGNYHWLAPENPPFWPEKPLINRDFSERSLNLAAPLELAGFVHIEAGFDNEQPWREIAWLETSCQRPFRSVAFIDLLQTEHSFCQQLISLKKFRSVVGVRYILDDQASTLLTEATVLKNLGQLAASALHFEVQMSLADRDAVQALAALCQQQPLLNIIINHGGWPPCPDNSSGRAEYEKLPWQQWLAGIALLSQFPQCAIKCSGWEMASRSYDFLWVRQVIDECLTAFGSERVMLASNFPLCLFSGSYQQYWQAMPQLSIATEQLSKLCAANARHWYKF